MSMEDAKIVRKQVIVQKYFMINVLIYILVYICNGRNYAIRFDILYSGTWVEKNK